MKRFIYLLAILPLLFTSCNKEEKVNNFAGYWYSDYRYKPDAETGFVSFVLRFEDVKDYSKGEAVLTFNYEDLGGVLDFYGDYFHEEYNSVGCNVEIGFNGVRYEWPVSVSGKRLTLYAPELVEGKETITFSRK